MSQVRIIKRYANRKLYDTQHSRYVTLDQISEMIRHGDDVKIIDNKSKEDLTSVTLAQIIFEEEKKQRSFLPLQAMRNIIQNGGESFAHLVTEAQRRVTSILPRRKDEDEPEADGAEPEAASAPAAGAGAPEPEPGVVVKKGREAFGSLPEFREWVHQSQRTIDEWHKRVDERIRQAVEGLYPFTGVQKDVKVLASRIAALEAKLERLAQHEATERRDLGAAELAHAPAPAANAAPNATPSATGDAMEARIVALDGSSKV